MTLGIVTALWGRPVIARAVMEHTARLDVPGASLVCVAAASPEDSDPVGAVEGWEIVQAPNNPLSGKFTAAVRHLRGRVDAVMVIGSDDFVSARYVRRALERVADGAEYVVPQALVVADSASGAACRCTCTRVGAGRVLSGSLLDRVDWAPWNMAAKTGLDGAMDRRLQYHATPALLKGAACEIVDVKSGVNLWSYAHVANAIGYEQAEARQELRRIGVSAAHVEAVIGG